MKTFIGYSIWNKVDMLAWILEGIVNNFKPADTEVGLCFEGCRDDSVAAFDAMRKYWLDSRGYRVHCVVSEKEVGQVGGHNLLIPEFMNSACDIMLAPQDDQKLENAVGDDLEKLLSIYGTKLGMVGGRYGCEGGNRIPATSPWSPTDRPAYVVNTGAYIERSYLNDGPVAYPRHLVEKIGLLDAEFIGFYLWYDYCQRAINAGFTNVLLGMNVTHATFGRVTTSWMGNNGSISSHDLSLLRKKHGYGIL